MASDTNEVNDPDSRFHRHKSRIMREMYHQSQHPFHEPPSSTGSHSTVTSSEGIGLSSTLSFDPDSQSTPKHEQDNPTLPRHRPSGRTGRFGTGNVKTVVNTSAIHKFFPDWAGQTARAKAGRDADAFDSGQFKENIPPAAHALDKSPELREAPALQANNKTSSYHRSNQNAASQQAARKSSRPKPTEEEAGSRRSSGKQPSTPEYMKKQPNPLAADSVRAAFPTPGVNNSSFTGRSFFLPSLGHINDLVSGTLRLSVMKDGAPVFVKQGKVRERSDPNNKYADIEAIELPEPEPAIFISVDKIRDEVARLQEHDEMLQRECEELRAQLASLYQGLLHSPKSRKRPDSAIGSESDQSMVERLNAQKNHFEQEIADLQARLDEALRNLRVNELHINSLSAERDSALSQSSTATGSVQKLRTGLDAAREELAELRREHEILLQERTAIQQDHVALEKQNEAFYVENNKLTAQATQDQRRIRDLEQRVHQRDLMIQQLQAADTTRNTAFGLEEENARLAEELELRSREMDKLKGSLDKVNDRLDQRKLLDQTRRDNVYDRVHELKREHKAQISELTQEHQVGVAEMSREHRDRISELEHRLAEAEEELRNVSGKNDKLARVVVEREKDLINILRDINDNVGCGPRDATAKLEQGLPSADREDTQSCVAGGGPARRPAGILKKSFAQALGEDLTGRYSIKSGMSLVSEHDNMTSPSSMASLDSGDELEEREDLEIGHGRKRPPPKSMPNNAAQGREAQQVETTSRERRRSDAAPVDANLSDDEDENMTSAFFLPDITVRTEESAVEPLPLPPPQVVGQEDTRRVAFNDVTVENEEQTHQVREHDAQTKSKQVTSAAARQKTAGPSLSRDARRVLDNLCEHECRNCSVCARISTHEKHPNCRVTTTTTVVSREGAAAAATTKDGMKKAIRIPRPVPVTDRVPEEPLPRGAYEEEPTMRPSQPPGQALAIVIKQMEDEIRHLEMEINAKQACLNVSDKSLSRRDRKALTAELHELLRRHDARSDQLYNLFDVLEGQKMAGQTMTQEEVDMTINSILAAH